MTADQLQIVGLFIIGFVVLGFAVINLFVQWNRPGPVPPLPPWFDEEVKDDE